MAGDVQPLASGAMRIVLPDGAAVSLDLIELHTVILEAERACGARDDNTDWITAAYWRDLAQRFVAAGVPGCTATMAYQLRERILDEWRALKKNMLTPLLSPGGTDSTPTS